MKVHEVESSNLAAVGWQTDGTLTVFFRNGSAYQYEGVPRGVYLRLLRAESHGTFFHKNIRNTYEYTRLETEE